MKIRLILYAVIFLFLFYSCDISILEPGQVSELIMITNDSGNVIGGNLSDWERDSSYFFYMVKPIYPNPSKNGKCTLYASQPRPTNIRLKFEDGKILDIYGPPAFFHYNVIDGRILGYRNTVRQVDIYVDSVLYTKGHIQFD